MSEIKVISFDMEGTLATTEFSYAIWFEAIPGRYAEKYGLTFEQAQKIVFEEYGKVGDQKLDWYDVKYWFNVLDIGRPETVIEHCRSRIRYFPETKDVLASLEGKYRLIVASAAPRDFLQHLAKDIEPHFERVFSSISDFKQLKVREFYTKICQELNVIPNQVIHIGDNLQLDYNNATEAGIKAFYLDRNNNSSGINTLTSLTQLSTYLIE
jgi:HAD superfamily hydrolase (TIGR01549 family)